MWPDPGASCLVFLPGVCVIWDARFPFWEVLVVTLISAGTIVASVWLARWTSRNEIRRAQREDRVARRSRLLREFADFCAEVVEITNGTAVLLGRVTQYMARVSPELEAEEHDAFEWMQSAVAELVDALELGEGEKADVGRNRGLEVFRERVDDLRGWARWPGDWASYLAMVGAREMTPWRERFRAESEATHPSSSA